MKSFSEKICMQKAIKKGEENKKVKNNSTRLLITVNVLGSAGPLRFVVSENDKVAVVVNTALKQYAREGRLPILSSNVNDFFLYTTNAGIDGTLQGHLNLNFSFFIRKIMPLPFKTFQGIVNLCFSELIFQLWDHWTR